MRDLFGHPIQPGPFTIRTVDGISGTESDFSEDRYLDPIQREAGWPAVHLYPFRNRHDWSPEKARQWVDEWILWSLPPGCDCSLHWQKTLETFPLDDLALSSPELFFDWTVNAHNHVNERLGKHQVPLAQAREIWSRIAAAGQVAWFRPVNDTVKGGNRLVITIATGKAREWLKYTEGPMRAYAAACDADFVVLQNTTQGWWGLEKFRVYEYARAYKQTLFIDADVLVTNINYQSVFEDSSHPIHIYDETPDIRSQEWIKPAWDKVLSCREDYELNGFYGRSFNTGVVYCEQSSAGIWRPPKLPIPVFHVSEQITIGINLIKFAHAVGDLPANHNLQVWNQSFRELLPSAKFVHLSGLDRKTEQLRAMIDRLESIGNPILKQDV